jgi:hypothetical protein
VKATQTWCVYIVHVSAKIGANEESVSEQLGERESGEMRLAACVYSPLDGAHLVCRPVIKSWGEGAFNAAFARSSKS